MTTSTHAIPPSTVRLHAVENVTSWHTHVSGTTPDGQRCLAEAERFPASTIGVMPTLEEVLVALRAFEARFHIGAFVVAGSTFGCDRANIDQVTNLTFTTVKPASRLIGTTETQLRVYDGAVTSYRCTACACSWNTNDISACCCAD